MDSPTELAEASWQEWQVQENGKAKTIRIALHHQGTAAEFAQFTEKTKKIIKEGQAIFGELPDFDFGTYTFIGCYGPQAASDGMEHRNSTSVTAPRPLKTGELVNLGTVSHEFFHAWNVERIRPKDLEPFNFEEANMSSALWFAEGFTNYYGDLLLCRSGVLSEEEYLKALTNDVNSFILQPGKDQYSAVEMSRQAPFVDAARSVDPVNRLNTYVSYYTHGGAIALALDLTLRTQFPGISLDDYMRTVWQKFGKTERPYQLNELEVTLGEVTKNEPFASEFFQKYVYGHAAIDFKTLFREAGLELRLAKPGKASLGYAPFAFANNGITLQSGTMLNSPLYMAGIEFEDVILTVGGKKLRSEKALQSFLAKHKPGEKLPLEFEHRGQKKTATITLIENPTLEIVKPEKTAASTLEKTTTFLKNWLGSKAKG
jgi:predicted metalloprotease with PDZ domain